MKGDCTVRQPFKSNYTTVTDHERIANDDYIQGELIRVIESMIPDQPTTISVTGDSPVQFDSQNQILGWKVDGESVGFEIEVRRIVPGGSEVIFEQQTKDTSERAIDFNDWNEAGSSTTFEFVIKADGFNPTLYNRRH